MFVSQRYLPVHPLLQDVVEYFQIVESAPMSLARSIPNTRIDGWLLLEGSFGICSDISGPYLPVPIAGLAPMRDLPIYFSTIEGFRVVNFKCYPHLLSMPVLASLKSAVQALAFEQIFPKKEVVILLEVLKARSPDEEKIMAIESFLAAWLLCDAPADNWLQSVLNAIRKSDGRVEHLAACSFVSVKTFERRFQQQIGISPKTFCKLARFQQIVKAINCANPQQPAQSHSWNAGYYDQSHFIKDCRAITGLPPSRLFSQLPTMITDLILMDSQGILGV
jgi:AraC-like DNA-binding protein